MQRNFIAFIVISIVILTGWYGFVTYTTPERKKDEGPKDIAQRKDTKETTLLTTGEKKTTVEEKKTTVEEKKTTVEEKKTAKEEVKDDKKPKDDKHLKKVEPPEPAKIETLGGEGFHLTAEVTSRGAGVRKVTLNRFKAADWRGKPTDHPLDLIPQDDYAPAFRMYHYQHPDDDNPVFGLGEKTWKLEKKEAGTDKDGNPVHRVKCSATVPGMEHVEIIKTYELKPKDYHITLLLELNDKRQRDPSGATPAALVRYQLTGGQGLPIEGEWYTATFRNAYMGMVYDKGGFSRRKLEDSPHISMRRGGDSMPEDKKGRGIDWLQYAGVANQYFGVMLVVDDEQPKRSDGGWLPEKILAWARPTLETREKSGTILKIAGDEITHHEVALQYKLLPDAREHIKGLQLMEGQKVIVTSHETPKGERAWIRSATEPAPMFADYRILKERRGVITRIGAEDIWFREEPLTYKMLPRTVKHREQLELDANQKAVLSFYETAGGTLVAAWIRLGETQRPEFDDITMRVQSNVVSLAPGEKVAHKFLLYHGPVKVALLAQFSGDKEVPADLVERYTHTLNLNTLTDYHSDNFFGRISNRIYLTDLIIIFTRLMHWLLNLLAQPFGYGLNIIALTLIVRGLMFPISRRQAMFSIKMQELGPEMKKIKERYKDDPQAQMRATWDFQKKHGIHPLSSCWPLFLQMPIFMGLWFALQESIHFRLAEFLWISSLSAPDMLVFWTEHIPIISSPDHPTGFLSFFYLGPYLNLLPIISAVLMLIVQMQTMPPPTDEQQEMQQKMMKYMVIMFGLIFYKIAAGMCIYFITSNLWGIAERKLLPKKKVLTADPALATTTTTLPANAPLAGAKWKGKNNKKDKEKEKEPETTMDKIKAWWKEVLKNAEKK